MDHSKFEDMEKGLKGEVIINKLSDDFSILDQFQVIKTTLPHIFYTSSVELEILSIEMEHYEIPSQASWKEVERFGKMKYGG